MPPKKKGRGIDAEKWDTVSFLVEKRPLRGGLTWKQRFERACRARGVKPGEHLRFVLKSQVQRFERLDPFGGAGDV